MSTRMSAGLSRFAKHALADFAVHFLVSDDHDRCDRTFDVGIVCVAEFLAKVGFLAASRR